MGMLILCSVFFIPPLVLTVLNVRNLFAKTERFPIALLFVTIVYGLFCYQVFLASESITSIPWHEPVDEYAMHQIISSEYFLSFIVPCAAGFAGLFVIAFFPAEKLSPLVAVLALAGICIGNVENILFALQVSKKFWNLSDFRDFDSDGFVYMLPYLYHVNLLLLSVFHISRIITTKLHADIVYILMKPAEWFFTFTLYLLCTDPEQRIRRQYAERQSSAAGFSYTIFFSDGKKGYFSVMLKGMKPFAELILQKISTEKTDFKTLEMLNSLKNGNAVGSF